MNISSPSSTITGTNPNSISSDDVDLEFGADPNTTSSPTPSIITPDHPAFVGCPTAAVQDLFEKCGSNADLLQAFAILLDAKAQSLTSSTGGAVVVEAPTVGAEVDGEEATKLSAALTHEAFTMFSCSETKKAVAKLLISLNDGGTSLKEFTSNWNTINITGLGITHKAFAGVRKADSKVLVSILHELDKDGNGLLSLYELIAGCFLFKSRIENLQKTKKKLSWTSIVLGLLSIISIFVAVWLSKDTSVSNGMLTVKGTDTPVETAVHHTVLHLGQPAGEDIALVDDATAPQGTATKANPNEKVLGCMTRAEVVFLRENSVAIPAAIESEDGSLHTVRTRDWEEDDMGKIKITDASGVHYEIKPDPSCSVQIKHGRRLATFNPLEYYTLVSAGGISLACVNGGNVRGTSENDVLTGGIGPDLLFGWDGNDELYGRAGDDMLSGEDGNDILHPGLGNNYIIGGAGLDTVVYPGGQAKSQYTFSHLIDYNGIYHFFVTKNDGTVDTLEEVERVQFADYRCTINETDCLTDIGSDPVNVPGCFVCMPV